MNLILPDLSFVGKIYGPTGGTAVKKAECLIITRITKTKVFARNLQMSEILKPTGNGFFNESNLGIVAIKKPLVTFGEEIPFFVYGIQVNNTDVNYIRNKNMILYRVDENVMYNTLSPGSSVFAKTGWH